MKYIKRISIVFALLLGLSSQSAMAIFIDQGDTILDTDNGLEWLKLTFTDALPVNTAIATYSADGWEHATEAQYRAMFDAYFPSYVPLFGEVEKVTVYPGTELYDKAMAFVDLFGLTHLNETVLNGASIGFYLGTDGILHYGGISFTSYAGSAFLLRDNNLNYDTYWTTAHPNAGTFLVRQTMITEPTSLLLFGLCLLGFGIIRRKQK